MILRGAGGGGGSDFETTKESWIEYPVDPCRYDLSAVRINPTDIDSTCIRALHGLSEAHPVELKWVCLAGDPGKGGFPFGLPTKPPNKGTLQKIHTHTRRPSVHAFTGS